jgi:FAD/FMN-containing dehydrogenase
VRSGYLHRLDDAIDVVLAYCGRMTSPFGMAELRVLGGAMARVPAEATAFVHRDKPFLVTAINAWDDPCAAGRHVAWTEAFWRALAPHTDGAYAGLLQDEGQDRVRDAYKADAYKATYARLADLKRRYDPTNLFQLNANIRPVEGAGPAA